MLIYNKWVQSICGNYWSHFDFWTFDFPWNCLCVVTWPPFSFVPSPWMSNNIKRWRNEPYSWTRELGEHDAIKLVDLSNIRLFSFFFRSKPQHQGKLCKLIEEASLHHLSCKLIEEVQRSLPPIVPCHCRIQRLKDHCNSHQQSANSHRISSHPSKCLVWH